MTQVMFLTIANVMFISAIVILGFMLKRELDYKKLLIAKFKTLAEVTQSDIDMFRTQQPKYFWKEDNEEADTTIVYAKYSSYHYTLIKFFKRGDEEADRLLERLNGKEE